MENNIENIDKNKNIQIIIFKKVSIVEKYNFFEYLSVMIDWWVSITEALNTVQYKVNSIYFKQKINELAIFVSSWDSLSKSMKKIPDIFTQTETSIIESWESTWKLPLSLQKVSDDLKKIHDLRSKIKSALTYPFIIFLFLLLALFIVLLYVIPQIKPLFETVNIDLPFSTKALIFTSELFVSNLLLIILIITSIIFLFLMFKSTESGKRIIENFIFSIPLIWKIYRNYILSNIASTLGNLVWSGVNIIKTLRLVWKSTNNSIYEKLFEDIVLRVSSWDQIVKSMEAVDPEKIYFPADYTQMLYVWEKTSKIEWISKKINIQYTKEVDYALWNLTKWIEPIAILLASFFVIWFAYAILWAILKITQTVW